VRVPSVLLHIGDWLFFVSLDRGEPPDVHVRREKKLAKVWFDPVALDRRGGFGRVEINRTVKLVHRHRDHLCRNGMSSSAAKNQEPRAQKLSFSDDALSLRLLDGRTLIVPLAWYPRLW